MRAPLSWLRDHADLPAAVTVDELTGAFSQLGLVVDGVERVGEGLDGVEVVRIMAIRPHPDADRIRLVDVDRGDGQALQIACGAWNMAEGDLVPLATIGTVLPSGMAIARRKMRGQESNGMLCSATEVGLPDDGVDGLLILPAGLAPGTPLTEALGIEADVIFDLDITPNRPDALCMAGIARDLAAALGVPAHPPATPKGAARPGPDPALPEAALAVDAPDLCPRLTGTVLTGVVVGPSPAWVARRLTLSGLRPINNVVDASNYVMLELGQPNHAYDLERLTGGGLLVRRARAGETLTTLDGVTRTLERDDCVVCDAAGVPVGIGGIIGGADSEIAATTTAVLLEAAYFSPMAIARTGTRLRLTSEARHRFERGVDPEVALSAVERFAELLSLTCPTLRRGRTVDLRAAGELPPSPTVVLRTARVNALLGTDLTDEAIVGLLAPIGFSSSAHGPGVAAVDIPSWRPDAGREIDVIEEVARLHGYGRIARTLPAGGRGGASLTRHQRGRRRVRDVLVGAGLSEAWTTTFLAPGDLERAGLVPAGTTPSVVEVENPLDRSESLLRTSLLPGLLKAARFNVDRQAPAVRLFEIGRVFHPPIGDAVVPVETEALGALLVGEGVDGRHAARLWTVLGDALRIDPGPSAALVAADVPGLHPGRSAHVVTASGDVIGALGEVDDEVSAAYGVPGRVAWLGVSLPELLALPARSGLAKPVSRYPASDTDLAFVVADEVPAATVAATITAAAGDLLEAVQLFDVYRDPSLGEARRSLAYRLRLRSHERTLTDAEVGAARSAVIDAVGSACGATLRA